MLLASERVKGGGGEGGLNSLCSIYIKGASKFVCLFVCLLCCCVVVVVVCFFVFLLLVFWGAFWLIKRKGKKSVCA